MKDFVEFVAKGLVDKPEDVQVVEVEGEQGAVLELRVAKEDLGKVIGKQYFEANSRSLAVHYQHNVGNVKRAFLMDDAALLISCRRFGMLCYHVASLNQDCILLYINGKNFSGFVFVFTCDNLYQVAFFNFMHS